MSTEEIDKRLAALDRHIDSMDAIERKKQDAKTRGKPEALLDLIEQGDAVGVAIAMRNGVSPTVQDSRGMNTLHLAAAYDTPLIGAVLMRETSEAPWQRDAYGRLPLDVARENAHPQFGNSLERVTYPGLFRGEKNGPVHKDLIAEYDRKRQDMGDPDTRPPMSREFTARESHRLRPDDRDRDKRSRGH